MMTLKPLKAGYWIVQHGGFARTTQKRRASQSVAASKRVHKLEPVLDTPLLTATSAVGAPERKAEKMLREKIEQMFMLARHRGQQPDRPHPPAPVER